MLLIVLLCRMDCLNRANVCTCTAVSTYIRIDLINIALRYCFHRTFVNASSACGTIIINYVCHFSYY